MPSPSEPPRYTKYRASPRLRPVRDEPPLPGDDGRPPRPERAPRRTRRLPGGWRLLRLFVLAVLAWLALSGVLFLVSAQFSQEGAADSALGGGATPPMGATTVLVLGSDQRSKSTAEPGSSTSGPSRADTILLLRVGGGASARLSIPRDTAVDIPGHGRQKINAAYAIGGMELAVRTVEAFLSLEVNHVVEVDFENFPELIDAMGGIDYTGSCVVSRINGGARNGGVTLRLRPGTNHLDGKQALALARTRKNECNPRESDLTRARRQQKLFSAMKGRLTSPGAFVRLPWIAWNAPRAIRSDMGGPSLLGVFAATATGGTPALRVLKPSGGETLPDGGAGLSVAPDEVRRERERFLAG